MGSNNTHPETGGQGMENTRQVRADPRLYAWAQTRLRIPNAPPERRTSIGRSIVKFEFRIPSEEPDLGACLVQESCQTGSGSTCAKHHDVLALKFVKFMMTCAVRYKFRRQIT